MKFILWKLTLSVAALAVLAGVFACGGSSVAERTQVDSLNALSYSVRYASLERAMEYAEKAESIAGEVGYMDGLHEAVLNRGDAYGMRMDYDSAQWCYMQVLEESDNGLLRCMADVDMMAVCLMTARNREFYSFRVDADECMADVLADGEGSMDERERTLWRAVQTEYHFVSANYFMKMRQDSGVAEEMDWLERNRWMFEMNVGRMSEYLFLRSMCDVLDADERQRDLMRLVAMSERSGNVYFEALALNGLARTVLENGEIKHSRRVFLEELMGVENVVGKDGKSENTIDGDVSFAELLAEHSLCFAKEYGNAFVQTLAMVTLSDCYLRSGRDSLALGQMEEALELINRHHRLMTGSDEKLYAYLEEEYSDSTETDFAEMVSTEMRWIADPDIHSHRGLFFDVMFDDVSTCNAAVPEWMAMVREQLSVVYGAMGMKAESDYNHNIYFDILDATRQDQRVEQEMDVLMDERSVLDVLLWMFVGILVLVLGVAIAYVCRNRHECREKGRKFARVNEICRRLSLVDSGDSEENVDEAILGEALCCVADRGVQDKFFDCLRQQREMVHNFSDEGRRIESGIYLATMRLEDNKKRHLEKLTSMSIVSGITPFIDRAMHEVSRLKAEVADGDCVEQVHRRLVYLGELIDKINEYNDVLGHWVKIKQGMVALNIENFALQPLFDTLSRGTRTFEVKGVRLRVKETVCVVKADKALTLFMMNTLLDNARKYTPAGGEVSLWAEESDTYVEVSVSDTGHGLSAEDVDVINNAKVYDSSKIGTKGEHSADVMHNKGFGFGLMNCRGIIGKYRKTNAVFSVCKFGVESEIGRGSRFFFRLPKGGKGGSIAKAVMNVVIVVLMFCFCIRGWAGDIDSRGVDDYLTCAARYTDSIYSANVIGDYEGAVAFADIAIRCLNADYLSSAPRDTVLMRLDGGVMAELEWWRQGVVTDYELIIRIRNEVAIASLALNRNALYHYNSEVFTRLYKLLSTDVELEERCGEMKVSNRRMRAILCFLGGGILCVLVFLIMLRCRHRRLMRTMRQEVERLTEEYVCSVRQRAEMMEDEMEEKRDELLRVESEQQQIYVRNQIMDNCLSTLKHETMYYPNRIKQIVDNVLSGANGCELNAAVVDDIDELLTYYKEVFSILSSCAGKQVEKVLFRRSVLSADEIGRMTEKSFNKQQRKAHRGGVLKVMIQNTHSSETDHLSIQCDKIFIQVLIDCVVSLYFEHRSGGDLLLDYVVSDGFVKFEFSDTVYRYDEDELAQLFYVDGVKYDAVNDRLVGAEYLVCRQIVREHDARSPKRGCRLYVENVDVGSRFVFTLPVA